MSAKDFPALRGPAIVCMQAGNINTGAFDPFDDIVPLAHEAGAWVHVDGAFGLWAMGVPSLRRLASGMATADSWATDAHKWLNVPFDSGLAFVRDAGRAARGHGHHRRVPAAGDTRRNPSDFTPELSRRARGVEIWAAMRSLGRSGLIEMFERNCRQARRFAEALSAAGYEILNDVVLNQVLVSFGPPEVDRARHPGPAVGRHLLVRQQSLARPGRDAHQRVLLGHDGCRRRAQHRRHAARRGAPGRQLSPAVRSRRGTRTPVYLAAGGGPTLISSISKTRTWPASSPWLP